MKIVTFEMPELILINLNKILGGEDHKPKPKKKKRRNKFQMQRDACWYLINREFDKTQEWIAKRMEQLTGIFVARETISDGLRHYIMENE